jgi:hypothetical protein
MKNEISILKGTHRGGIIGGELRQRKLSQRTFVDSIGIYLQTSNSVITAP